MYLPCLLTKQITLMSFCRFFCKYSYFYGGERSNGKCKIKTMLKIGLKTILNHLVGVII